jgi:hypothetical protein
MLSKFNISIFNKKRQICLNILYSILSILFGGLIYIFFREKNLLMFKWFYFLDIEDFIFKIRKKNNFIFPDWFIYNLPDGLWLFSYVSIMLKIWKHKLNLKSLFWIFIMPFIAFFSEIFQYFNIINGTFDIFDLIFYFLGTYLAILLNIKKINFNNKFYEKN